MDKTEKIGSHAHLDLSRQERCGFPEFIYGASKTPEQIVEIMSAMDKREMPVLATRIPAETADFVLKRIPHAEYDRLARTLAVRQGISKRRGTVLVVCAGTSDMPVALEAKITGELCGCDVDIAPDCGVAGLHRLLSHKDRMDSASVIIAVAGMEGALPSVIAGLVKIPVIAVPTSVGYGASFQGIAALLAMLNSCASGVTVVNIDNGFGAACAAARILPLR